MFFLNFLEWLGLLMPWVSMGLPRFAHVLRFAVMSDPMSTLALAPSLVSTEATWSKDLIASRNFRGFLQKTMIMIIFTILAIEGSQGPSL